MWVLILFYIKFVSEMKNLEQNPSSIFRQDMNNVLVDATASKQLLRDMIGVGPLNGIERLTHG